MSYLYPKVVRKRGNLGRCDIAIERANFRHTLPEKLYMVYIDNGNAKIATTKTVDRIPTDWEYQFTIAENVQDACIEFDGYWVRFGNKRRLVTVGEPWVFWIDQYGSILAKQLYSNETPYHLSNIFEGNHVASNIVAMRGWKDTVVGSNDQGLILAYIKNKRFCYRNLAEQVDGTKVWESQKEVDIFGEDIKKVSLFRGNDYRVGVLAESYTGKIYLAVTKRNYGVMGIDDEKISCSISDFAIEIIKVYGHIIGTYTPGTHTGFVADYKYNTLPDEVIRFSIGNYSITRLYGVSPIVKSIVNTDAETIVINFDEQVFNMTDEFNYFNVVDQNGIDWNVLSTAQGESTRQMVLTCVNFNNAAGDLNVIYSNTSSAMVGEAGQKVDSFNVSFTPTGLVPDITAPPAPENLWHE